MKIKARWIILLLLFLASVINYVDRQTLSILAKTIQQDLNMSDLDYSHVVQMFLLAYMLSFLVAGWLTDKLGEKRALTLVRESGEERRQVGVGDGLVLQLKVTNTSQDAAIFPLDPAFDRLWQRLGEADDFARRVALIEEWVARKLQRLDERDHVLSTFLDNSLPAGSVAGLAGQLCYSPRQLHRKTQTLFGLSTESLIRYKRYLQSVAGFLADAAIPPTLPD